MLLCSGAEIPKEAARFAMSSLTPIVVLIVVGGSVEGSAGPPNKGGVDELVPTCSGTAVSVAGT